jgi:hypothetical protein
MRVEQLIPVADECLLLVTLTVVGDPDMSGPLAAWGHALSDLVARLG